MDTLFENKQMEGETPIKQATRAIAHTLRTISDSRQKWNVLGMGTQSYALLTEAASTIWERPIREVRELFQCSRPAEPELDGGRFVCRGCKADFQLHYQQGKERPATCPFCQYGKIDLY